MIRERGNKFLRFLDRWVGIPLVFILFCFKNKRKLPKEIRSIGILKSAGIGDTVLLTALLKDLRRHFPKAKLKLFLGRSNGEMGALIPFVETVILPITNPLRTLRLLKNHSVSVCIDADPWPRINALYTFFSKSQFTIGFQAKGEWRHFLYDAVVSHAFTCHEVDNYRRLLKPLNVDSLMVPPKLLVSPYDFAKPTVILHLFSGGARADLKEWPLENWKQLTEKLVNAGFYCLFTGALKDKPRLEAFLKPFQGHNISCACESSLVQSAAFLAGSICVISVDTGIMHLAGALQVPVIALHGPTSPLRWGAIGEKVVAITPSFRYDPCIQRGFESHCQTAYCMRSITVDRVFDTFKELTHEGTHPCRRKGNSALAIIP